MEKTQKPLIAQYLYLDLVREDKTTAGRQPVGVLAITKDNARHGYLAAASIVSLKDQFVKKDGVNRAIGRLSASSGRRFSFGRTDIPKVEEIISSLGFPTHRRKQKNYFCSIDFPAADKKLQAALDILDKREEGITVINEKG